MNKREEWEKDNNTFNVENFLRDKKSQRSTNDQSFHYEK